MAKTNLKLVSPAKENRTVTPLRRPNSELRPREHLTDREIGKLIEAGATQFAVKENDDELLHRLDN